jgi:cyanophycin synthetase
LAQLARLNGVVANSTGDGSVTVLNADDHWCVRLAEQTNGEVIYFSLNPDNEVIRQHLQTGGRALTVYPNVDCKALCLLNGTMTIIPLPPAISAARAEGSPGNVVNVLAAVAACVGLGINHAQTCQGLQSFFEDSRL